MYRSPDSARGPARTRRSFLAIQTGAVDTERGLLAELAEEFDRAFTEGAGMGLDETIRYALDEKPTKRTRVPTQTNEPGGLTRREQELAELVARGMSNKEIATTLVISRRTVETHIENILAKLSFTNRIQIGPWLAEQEHPTP